MDRLYSTTALLGVIDTLDKPTAWLRDTFFPDGVQFFTTEIAFDKLKMRRNMAPFVSPNVAGQARKARGRTVSTFEPAYVKPKNEISPDENFVRLAGEQIAGKLSPEQRFHHNMLQLLADQEREITRREEWMVAQILQTGKVVVAGDDYPEQTVDFGRHADLTKALTGGIRWGEAGVEVMADLRSWATLVATTSGATVTKVVFGASAAELFQKDADVREVLDNRRQVDGQFQLGPVATGGEDMVAAYLGSIGAFDFYQYTQKFEDESGTVQDFFPDYGVLLHGQQMGGAMCHGAIRDNKSLAPLPRYPDVWDQRDPSVTFVMTQSAPLPVPREIDATAFVTVR